MSNEWRSAHGLRSLLVTRRSLLAARFSLLAVLGVWIAAPGHEPLYTYAWQHTAVMLLGQFALLSLAALCARRRWVGVLALALFWVFSGMVLGPLVMRAAAVLHGVLAALAAAALSFAVALTLFAALRRRD